MWFILLVTYCTLITNVISAPTPQDFELPNQFDVESIGQGNLRPQGFASPQRDSRQANDNGISVTRYLFEFNELAYKYT